MKKRLCLCLIIACLFYSCNDSKNKGEKEEFTNITINIEQDVLLPISTIAEKIETIELEMTDESLINPDRIQRILITDDNIIVLESFQTLVFNRRGKFIRSIGQRGQGPGEFIFLLYNIAIDEKNKNLFLNTTSKIICYDLNGKFLKEREMNTIHDINFINNELLVFVANYRKNDSKGFITNSIIYKLNNDLQIIDSIPVQNTYFDERPEEMIYESPELILYRDTFVSFYLAKYYFEINKPLLHDTLYNLRNNCLIPELKLDFNNDKIENNWNTFINISNIYRSSRYIFSNYYQKRKKFQFCFDTKTGKGYNMQDGFIDDVNGLEQPVQIRPFSLDTERFYYWHTHMKPDDLEEMNPTLYIGTLKK